MAIGSLGDITFEVTDTRVFTFNDLKRSVKNRIAKHEVINAKPLTELVGPDLDELKFTMLLSASLGINPLTTMKQIYDANSNGTAMNFVLGQNVIGANKWIISEFNEDYGAIDNQGNVWQMKIDVTLQEYAASIGDPAPTTTTTTTTATTTASTTATDSSTDDAGITGDGDGGENPTDTEDDT